jgi:hypothetical protein
VSITLTATAKPAGACEAGSTCFDARCVPATGAQDAGTGGGCAMNLVAAGPLGDPLYVPNAISEVASAPAAAATETGFLVTYREYDPNAGTAGLTVVWVDPRGVLTVGAPTSLPTQCAGQDETDAVALGYSSGTGVIVSARPSCNSQPAGFDAFPVDATGKVGQGVFTSTMAGKPALSLHAVALTSATAGYLAYAGLGPAAVIELSGLFPQGTPITFGDVPMATLAEVAAGNGNLALLAGGPSAADAGTTGPALSLVLGTSLAAPSMPSDFAGDWGAVALAGRRGIVLSDSSVSAQPVAWHTFDPAPGLPATATFAPGGATGKVIGGDVAVQSDLAYFAVEPPGSLALDVFDHASTTPALLRAVTVSSDPRVPSLTGIRDGKVAVAASASQVLITWVTGTTLGPDDNVGGWALYSCVP